MELVYIFYLIKLYIFIFTSILHFNVVACWPRYKRSSEDLNPTFTASLYDQLKESLAPVLQQSIDLTAPPIKRIDFKALEKRFKKENKQETVPDLKAIFRDAERALKQNPDKLGRRRSLSRGFIKTLIAPHLNKTVAAIADHENDYDYGDRDLPDVEEPPAHIFENSRGDSSNKKIENIAQKKMALLRYPFKKNEKIATQLGSNYERFRQRLAPLVEKSIDLVEPTKLQDKLLEPYMPGTYKEWKNRAANSDSVQSTAYISLYDQFKRRLLDFSNELGIDVGLEDTRNSRKQNNTKLLPRVFKKLKRPKKLKLAPKNARLFHNKLQKNSAQHHKQKRDNHDETLSRNNKLAPDIEFLMQQRGYINQNHQDKSAEETNVANVKNIHTSVNSFVDGEIGCDYNDDVLKPISIIKNHKKPFETNLRSFRNIDDSSVYKTTKKSAGSLDADFFPNVFVEHTQAPAGSTSTSAASSLLEIVAQKLNISTLEAAKKIAAIQDLNLTTVKNDPKLHKILQQYIKNSVVEAADQAFSQTNLKQNQKNDITMEATATTTRSPPFEDFELCGLCTPINDNPLEKTQAETALVANNSANSGNAGNKVGLTEKQVNQILDKLLTKLREIELEKTESESENPNHTLALEDAPCKISGSWFSAAMGLRFDIKFPNRTDENTKSEAQHYTLKVDVQECVPKRQHDVIDTTWPFMGSAMKELGGPFYLYTQKKSTNMLATFVGYCRTCGNMDTLFGTWSFSLPAKCCLDTPASFQTKNDVMHRYALEEKRRERYKELLYKKKNLPV